MPRKRRRRASLADVSVDGINRPTKTRRVKKTEANNTSLEVDGHSLFTEFSVGQSLDRALLSDHGVIPTPQTYAELKRSKNPKEWRRLPSLKMVQLLTSQWLIPSMVEVNLENLDSTIQNWFNEQKIFVDHELQEIEIQQYSPWLKKGERKASKRDLVAIQFQCLRCFDVAIRHMLSDSCKAACDYSKSLDFSDHFKLLPTTPLAAWILDDQQLDVFTTTADMLDAENRAYECIQCRFAAQDDEETRDTPAYYMYMTWREFINHKCAWNQDVPFNVDVAPYQSIEYNHLLESLTSLGSSNYIPETCFYVVDGRCVVHDLQSQNYSPNSHLPGDIRWPIYSQRKLWSCGICNEFVDGLGSRKEVEEHLRVKHGVTSPRVPEDIFYAADL
ncbi:hypothetical protein Moror_2055 [Moniliophthora roreri MCA 2997]|uniref:Uncharacterized protein n=1 Tax=Moniliophthora roreri (strain MCA 2997) TaxID=1381753 RepID=V2X4W9_MONRO|nr:hypothetical protein Moror_2055 [Moniliophthora roreri MCA 2997]